MPRYETSGIPSHLAQGSELGLSAFMPHFNRLAASGAQVYKGFVTGRPGTHPIPIDPFTQAVPPSPDPGDMALMGTSRSSDAPPAIWPNQYWNGLDPYQDIAGGTMRIQMYNATRPQDTTMIPVPATDLRSVYQARSATLSIGLAGEQSRLKALKQIAGFSRWKQRRSGNGIPTG